MFCLPKNIPSNIIKTSGNTGLNFDHLSCKLPEEIQCALVLEENNAVYLIREDANNGSDEDIFLNASEDSLLYIDCLSE